VYLHIQRRDDKPNEPDPCRISANTDTYAVPNEFPNDCNMATEAVPNEIPSDCDMAPELVQNEIEYDHRMY
jgi:hypothetical protein